MTKLRPAPSPHTTHQDGRAGRTVHAEHPDRPGHSLCGARLGHNASPGRTLCIVCADLARPAYWTR